MAEIEYAWQRTVGPVLAPITLDLTKLHLSQVQADDDLLIDENLRAAVDAAEEYLRHGLMTQTWLYGQSAFTDTIRLPMAKPLQSVSSVQYYAESGTLTTLSSDRYTVDTYSEPGRIALAPAQAWPSLQTDRRGLRVFVTYVVGWTREQDVPALIRQGLRLWLAGLDMDRTGGTPEGEAARTAAQTAWAQAGPVYWTPPRCA